MLRARDEVRAERVERKVAQQGGVLLKGGERGRWEATGRSRGEGSCVATPMAEGQQQQTGTTISPSKGGGLREGPGKASAPPAP